MNQIFNIDEILKIDNKIYSGENFIVVIKDKEYSFVKGNITHLPRSFNNRLYNVNTDQSAAYFIQDFSTGKIYIGSSGKIYKRICTHKQAIVVKKHSNKNFTKLLQDTPSEYFDITLIFTNSREEAYEIEQYLLNLYINNSLLLNIGLDVKLAMKGRVLTEDHKNKISISNTGKKLSLETRAKMSAFSKTNERAINHFKEILETKKRKIMVYGVEYESIHRAGILSGLSESCIRRALRNKRNPEIYSISDNVSPLLNRTISEQQKQKLSEFRKNNITAINQFAEAREKSKRKIILNGVLYESVKEAIKKTGISECTIHRQLSKFNGKIKDGPYILNYQKRKPWKVSIKNEIFDSISIASRELKINKVKLKDRLRAANYSDYFYIKN